MEYHAVVSALAVALTFMGYVPYIYDTLKGRTQPHLFTWLSVSLTSSVICALQILGGAGVGAWPMVVVSGLCVLIFTLSLQKGTKNVTILDFVFFILAIAGLLLWLFIDQPLLAVIVITSSSVISYLPTVRKSWSEPYSETLVSYQITGVRHVLSIIALEKINLLTTLFPAVWAIGNLAIVLMLMNRRKETRNI